MAIRNSLDPTLHNVSIETRHFEQVAPVAFGDYSVRIYSVPNTSERRASVSCGVTVLPSHKRTTISGVTGRHDDASFERIAVMAKGSLLVQWNGLDHSGKLELFSCLYIPSDRTCIIENPSNEVAVLAWARSNSRNSFQKPQNDSIQIVRPFEEIEPVVLSIKGLERSIYRLRQTKGFHFAIFKRGANTYSPLHTHDPADFEEAFIVLEGKLWVTDLNGQTSVLNELDFAYVPPFGGNLNENRAEKEVKYLWIGSPPVDMKEKPVDKEFSKFENQMALDKAK